VKTLSAGMATASSWIAVVTLKPEACSSFQISGRPPTQLPSNWSE